MIDNIIPVILIFLYLIVIFLINYFYNINPKKKKEYKLKIDDIDPAIALYCYNSSNVNKLFWVTLLSLIQKKYYKLDVESETTYLKIHQKEIKNFDDSDLKEYEKKVILYINNLIVSDNENKQISLSELKHKVETDLGYQSVVNSFSLGIKKEAITKYGNIDHISVLEGPLIITFIYALQVFYFFSIGFNFSQIIMLSIALCLITAVIINIFKDSVHKYTLKKHIIMAIISLVLAIISYFIWKSNVNVDYIIFHIVLGILSFMYPLLVITDIYLVKTNSHYLNRMQKDIINQLENFKNDDSKVPDIYIYGLKIKDKKISKELTDFINIFKI